MLQGVGGAGPLRRAFASSLLLSFPDFLGNVRIVFQRVCRDSVSQCSGRLFDSPFRIGRMLTQETQNGFFSGVVMCMVMMRVSISFVVVVVVVGSFHVVVCSNSGERGARKRRLSVFFSVVRGGAEWRYIETADDPKADRPMNPKRHLTFCPLQLQDHRQWSEISVGRSINGTKQQKSPSQATKER